MLYRKQENPQLVLYWHLITQVLCNPQEVIFQLCSVWVRSSLEYCVRSEAVHLKKNGDSLERSQKRPTRMMRNLENMIYEKRFKELLFEHFFSSRKKKKASWDETRWKTSSTLSITSNDNDELCRKGNGENGFSFCQRLDIRKHLLLGKSGTGEKHPELVLWLVLFKDETDIKLLEEPSAWCGQGVLLISIPALLSVIYDLSVTELCWFLRLQSAPRHQRLHLERFTGWPSAKQFLSREEKVSLAVTQLFKLQLTEFSALLISWNGPAAAWQESWKFLWRF